MASLLVSQLVNSAAQGWQSFARRCVFSLCNALKSCLGRVENEQDLANKTGAEVVDLAADWPQMLRDRPISGANQKDLLLFAHLARDDSLTDWVCRVETDSYFIPANFRRFEPFYLGSLAYWHLHFEPRMIFNEQVQCMSRATVKRLGRAVSKAPWASEASYARCEVVPGHRGDIMRLCGEKSASITQA
eukprot:s4575_g4.t1